MSMYPEDQYALRVLKAGASGYLGKETIHEDLIRAIETVILGKRFITPSIAEKLAGSFHIQAEIVLHEMLSDREFDVLKLLASGKSISEIALQLSLSSTTVSTYRSPGVGAVVPIIHFKTRKNWYAEPRYNYEDIRTISFFGDKTFKGEIFFEYSITRLVGFSTGTFTGISAGTNIDAE